MQQIRRNLEREKIPIAAKIFILSLSLFVLVLLSGLLEVATQSRLTLSLSLSLSFTLSFMLTHRIEIK